METAIRLKSLTEQVHDHLSEAIIEGKFKAGERLLENDLCRQFSISRSPLRECFRILESEGLVIINPRKGTTVKQLTSKELNEVFPVRASLESLAAKLAIPNIGEKEIQLLNDLIKEMAEALKKRDIRSFLWSNHDFHSTIIKSAKNQLLGNILKNLGKGLWLRISFLYYQSQQELIFSNETHKKIVNAFTNKDAANVQKLLQEHIVHAGQYLLMTMNRNNSISSS